MKREIKFRAWITETVDDNDNPVFEMIYPDRLAILEYGLLSDQLRSTDNCILMQYTGLKDINGKEIYEGDIVKTITSKEMVIGWSDRFASFTIEKINWAFVHYFGELMEANECEVIGNIHENPELI